MDISVNAGPRAINGFALQRNTALFLLLDNFIDKFKDKEYFISLEHHDDFLFCFFDSKNHVEYIEAYQSKKKSPDIWKINDELLEIINKLLETGSKLLEDPINKSLNYKHSLYFSSNTTIFLEEKKTKTKTTPSKSINQSINEEESVISFKDLDKELQNKIRKKLKESSLSVEQEKELNNLNFIYIAFTRKDKEQQNQLHGKLQEVFKEEIYDYRAALNALMYLFREIEATYNQGHKAKLLDKTKRVSSKTINETMKILTTKSKAFDYWRREAKSISKALLIKPYEKEYFEEYFKSSFELFKSIEEAEHRKIFNFVDENYLDCKSITEEDCVLELFEKFKQEKNTYFEDIQLKAVIYASYFESINKKEN